MIVVYAKINPKFGTFGSFTVHEVSSQYSSLFVSLHPQFRAHWSCRTRKTPHDPFENLLKNDRTKTFSNGKNTKLRVVFYCHKLETVNHTTNVISLQTWKLHLLLSTSEKHCFKTFLYSSALFHYALGSQFETYYFHI